MPKRKMIERATLLGEIVKVTPAENRRIDRNVGRGLKGIRVFDLTQEANDWHYRAQGSLNQFFGYGRKCGEALNNLKATGDGRNPNTETSNVSS